MREIDINGTILPAMMIGSSPFCGATQFGEKSQKYFNTFYEQPMNIADLLVKMYKKGYKGAHLIPLPPIIEAALRAYDEVGSTFPVIMTLMPDQQQMQWSMLRQLDTVAVFLHAQEADKLQKDTLEHFSATCREYGMLPGFSTHNGGITIPQIDRMGIDAAAYLCPFNKTGAHVHPSLDATLEAAVNTDKIVIGMKIMACGQLDPEEAFQFALPYVDAATVGMVTSSEIDEDCALFEKYSHLLGTKRQKTKVK